MATGATKPKLAPKCFVEGVLYRPAPDEVGAYYSRDDVLDELLGGMRRWHVRLEGGEGLKHRWLNTGDRDELRRTFRRLLDRMSGDSRRVKLPYLRIDGRRYDPAASWQADDLWGLDFGLEKDGWTRRECWDAVVPATKILDHFGVHYWLKYTGHHSLHVIVPAENFPTRWGKLRLVEYLPSFHRRLLAFFDRLCFQPLDEGGFHGPTGLLNYPIRRREVRRFQPGDSHPSRAKVRSFWREFPADKRGCAAALLEEVLRPFHEQRPRYPGVKARPPLSLDETLAQMDSSLARKRKDAVVRLPWFGAPQASERLLAALSDRSSEVRRAAVKALAGSDDPRCRRALRKALAASGPQLARWTRSALKLISDIDVLRRAGHGRKT